MTHLTRCPHCNQIAPRNDSGRFCLHRALNGDVCRGPYTFDTVPAPPPDFDERDGVQKAEDALAILQAHGVAKGLVCPHCKRTGTIPMAWGPFYYWCLPCSRSFVAERDHGPVDGFGRPLPLVTPDPCPEGLEDEAPVTERTDYRLGQ